ncbi:hypothetical protein BS78_02G074100 [Paspalum vaginatum]|nr:hypothetical protein BS78_02G074100 [Paspalum vaginatum]
MFVAGSANQNERKCLTSVVQGESELPSLPPISALPPQLWFLPHRLSPRRAAHLRSRSHQRWRMLKSTKLMAGAMTMSSSRPWLSSAAGAAAAASAARSCTATAAANASGAHAILAAAARVGAALLRLQTGSGAGCSASQIGMTTIRALRKVSREAAQRAKMPFHCFLIFFKPCRSDKHIRTVGVFIFYNVTVVIYFQITITQNVIYK